MIYTVLNKETLRCDDFALRLTIYFLLELVSKPFSVQTVSNAFPCYFSSCTTYNQQISALSGKIYELLLWEKSMVAAGAAAERARIVASGDRPTLDLFEKPTAKGDQFAALARKQPEGDPEKWRDYLQQIGEEANQLERELMRRSATFAGQEKLLRPSWLYVQKSLKADEAAVEFVRFHFCDGKQREQGKTGIDQLLAIETEPKLCAAHATVPGEKNLPGFCGGQVGRPESTWPGEFTTNISTLR